MAVIKDEKKGTWRVVYRYTDWDGKRKQSQKRGFTTRREAQAWEREQLVMRSSDIDMTFQSFYERYKEDKQSRLKQNTWEMKDNVVQTKIMPYFGKLKLSNITAQQIVAWQNKLLAYRDENGKPYSPVYLRTIHNQMSCIFNHAVRFYGLNANPCLKAGTLGKKKNREMLYWTKDEYLKFAEQIMDKPEVYYAGNVFRYAGEGSEKSAERNGIPMPLRRGFPKRGMSTRFRTAASPFRAVNRSCSGILCATYLRN